MIFRTTLFAYHLIMELNVISSLLIIKTWTARSKNVSTCLKNVHITILINGN